MDHEQANPAPTGTVLRELRRRLTVAIGTVVGPGAGPGEAHVRPAGEARFGDYQCNAAMTLARGAGLPPRRLAEQIKAAADPLLAGMAEPLEMAGPGFLNIRLRSEFLAAHLSAIEPPPAGGVDRVGIGPVSLAERVVVDYSAPNIAKQMHVGHVRSTILGDVLARVLSFLGHDVIRHNHVGDWGTQFGLVIFGLWYYSILEHAGDVGYLERTLDALRDAGEREDRPALERIVRDVKERQHAAFAADPDGRRHFEPFLLRIQQTREVSLDELEVAYRFASQVDDTLRRLSAEDPYLDIPRRVTKDLQLGQEQERRAWQYCRDITLQYCAEVYRRLGVLLQDSDVRGESFYSERLEATLAEVAERAAPDRARREPGQPHAELREDGGALCLFLYQPNGNPAFHSADGQPLPMIVRKSDGAFLYSTTDLAAARYRVVELGAKRVLYVVGAPQKLHLEMLFTAARALGWVPAGVRLEHVSFGQILGSDRKLLRTRAGGTIKLDELLDEAERRAADVLEAKLAEEDESYRATFSAQEKRHIATRVGVAAVKYFDLARERHGDYVFSWDAMLALKGNTAPYMMFAYASIRSIFRKGAERFGIATSPSQADAMLYRAEFPLRLEDPSERALALRLTRLSESIEAVAEDLCPHVLCTYLYELAADFMRFYNACPVLQAPDEPTRMSRLRLCDLTARTLRLGLGLLGIEAIERM
jgi:arginyl-tRNA synthetase